MGDGEAPPAVPCPLASMDLSWWLAPLFEGDDIPGFGAFEGQMVAVVVALEAEGEVGSEVGWPAPSL